MKRPWRPILLLLTIALTWLTGSSSLAQNPLLDIINPDKTSQETQQVVKSLPEQVKEKLESSSKSTKELRDKLIQQAENLSDDQVRNLKTQIGQAEELALYYQQTLEVLTQKKDWEQKNALLQGQLSTWNQQSPSLDIEPSFSELDKLEDQLQLSQSEISANENTIKTLETNLQESKRGSLRLEKERRRTKEELKNNEDSEIAADQALSLQTLQWESKIAEARVTLTKIEIENAKLSKAFSAKQKALLNKTIVFIKSNAKFSEENLQEKLSQLQAEKTSLKEKLDELREQLQSLDKNQINLNDQQNNKLLAFRRQNYQQQISILAERYQRIDELEETWRRRYLAFNQLVQKTTLAEWEIETEAALEQAQRQENLFNVRLSDLRKKLAKTKRRLNKKELPKLEIVKGRNEVTQLESLIGSHQDYLSQLYQESQLYSKFINEIQPHTSSLSIGERINKVWHETVSVWNFELTSIDDSPITVKKLIFVLILLLVGFRAARRLSAWVGRDLLPRFGLEEGVAAGAQTLIFYLLVTLVTLMVLYTVNVPLTMFTVLGGALAIGIGFGSQNIVRNFISGLILLLEQPIKVGDMVEVDDTHGSIERIGARSTVIRGFNNVHAIIPNSDLLEKKVVNWTLSDDLIRVSVNVGVAYGSNTRDTAKLIRKAVDEHGKVIANPEPIVLFKEFGDNSLNFEVHFWIQMRNLMERERVQSDIRYRIDSLFRDAGITIAFPQRDVHLDSLSPIQVKLMPEDPIKKPKASELKAEKVAETKGLP